MHRNDLVDILLGYDALLFYESGCIMDKETIFIDLTEGKRKLDTSQMDQWTEKEWDEWIGDETTRHDTTRHKVCWYTSCIAQ